jgi:prolyl 4-hydroxylase
MDTLEPIIDDGWKLWIFENLQRRCEIGGMVTEMEKRGFSHQTALEAIQAAANKHKHGTKAAPWYEQPMIRTFDKTVKVSKYVEKPRILLLDDVLSAEECDELIARSLPKLVQSSTMDRDSGSYVPHKDRTSESAYHGGYDEFLNRINRRFSDIMDIPLSHGEEIQVVRYQPMGEYKAHWDYFPPIDPGSQKEFARGGQRISTLLMYLNDVEEGGATYFPNADVRVTPKKGNGVYFQYLSPNGILDPNTLHAGEPVLKGLKWIATKWMRVGSRL